MAQRNRTPKLVIVVVALALTRWTASFVPPSLPSSAALALGAAQALAIAAPASAAVNPEAYFAAAGVNPKDVENQIIDQMDPTDAALLGASDFWWGTAVPFSAGLGLVYGIGILTGQLDGPFQEKEDGKDSS
ncbi:unnamed protein product [Effrenium voratum]|uniref:Uncharacterized protein n=1 Tax=Effrenium voratum TaxID=2562239 RepID=A0AA36NDI6_9DINO|nr:unnamed protein product [Effrenium voratum]CAJ1423875.1 unnamed protein product [Effrenium voratum]